MNKKFSNIIESLEACKGDIGFYYKNLVKGEELGYNEDKEFMAASVIKLPIFAVVMKKVAEGSLDLDMKITVSEENILPSCGAINLYSTPPVLDLKTLCNFMIALSDNTATNLVIDLFGIEKLNEEFSKIGFEKTHLERYLFDREASKLGYENYFVPTEIGRLLEKLYKKEFINKETSEEMLKVLKMQKINHKIPGLMKEKYEVAHKTGEDDGISNDVGIVFCEKPFIVVFASNNANVGEFENLIRQISLQLTMEQ